MKHIQKTLIACTVALLTLANPLLSSADDDLPTVTGEVKKVKPKSGKITIKHEEIPNLDMPGMTMVFRTEEGTDISQFKKGDGVEFTVIEKDGKMYIVAIEKTE